jgi:hypothetical protein
MARSQYVYIVLAPIVTDLVEEHIVAAFTVKRELVGLGETQRPEAAPCVRARALCLSRRNFPYADLQAT